MFVMVFAVETITIFCDGFCFILFSVGTKAKTGYTVV